MMARTQITLEAETQRLARKRASDLGVSLAEYVRRLVKRDLDRPRLKIDPSCVFDLGSAGPTHIAADKDRMIGEAFSSARRRSRR